MDKYADKLSDGQKAVLKKYPQTYHLDVYQTRRTFAAPQYIYDNVYKNATRVKAVDRGLGPAPVGAIGGIPFPFPKNGNEVMWNVVLRFQGTTSQVDTHNYMVTAGGKLVLLADTLAAEEMPYYFPEMTAEKLGDVFWVSWQYNNGPPIRAGEAHLIRMAYTDTATEGYIYIPGQRRTRKLANPCCDTPAPQVAGVMSLDELTVYSGSHMERQNWKILGKKELYIPYNCNGALIPTKDTERIMPHHINPKYIRWELHRVWVVEATLKPGYRHQVQRSIYYVDEDSWCPVLADRWDASGRLWKTFYGLPMLAPDMGVMFMQEHGFYDLVSGVWAPMFLFNEKDSQYPLIPRIPLTDFTPAALASLGVR
jgi:hypothetical protein